MSFKYLSYQSLTSVVNTQKPYRGRDRAEYPYYNRKHGHKYFTVDELNGEKVYRIFYGNMWNRVEITKEEFNAITTQNKYIHDSKCYTYHSKPNEIGIVRPDDSFEFTAEYMNQSEMMLLNQILVGHWTNGYLQRSVHHGGMMFRSGKRNNDNLFYPIVEGLRVDIATLSPHESGSYKVVGRRVSRKAVNDLLGKYKEMFKVSETMAKTMTSDDYIDASVDIWKEHKFNGGSTGHENRFTQERAWDAGEQALSKSHMLDAFILFSLAFSYILRSEIGYKLSGEKRNFWYRNFPNDLYSHYESSRRSITKHLYQEHEEVFNKSEFEFGKKYPASEWGYEVLKNGVEVKQY